MRKIHFIIIVFTIIFFATFANSCTVSDKENINSDSTTIDLIDKPALDDASMQTEHDFYLPDTKRILVYWKNNSNRSLLFGESWYLEKFDNAVWKRITKENEVAFISIGYPLHHNGVIKHVYQVTDYADLLSEGLYRIVTHYYDENDVPVDQNDEYILMSEFTVTNDKSKIKQSELYYDELDNSKDITPRELEQLTSIRIYKDKKLYDTTLVINGEKYKIGDGKGHWGVVDISFYEADNHKYLIYTYSRTTDTLISRVAVFDLESLKDIFVSEPFSGFDLCVGGKPLEGTNFTVSSLNHSESEDGGHSDAITGEVGLLTYKNGEFKLEKGN